MTVQSSTRLLDALHSCNQGRPPIWILRQAGRYLPSYQALRKAHTLREMFFTKDLIVEATLLPIRDLGVDAAILFSDISVIAETLHLHVDFLDKHGPFVTPSIETPEQVDTLRSIPAKEALGFIGDAIRELRQTLSVPLIGFCGGPFTVARYLINIKRWIYQHPASVHLLLQKLMENTQEYLDLQIDAGAQAIQIFDSAAYLLNSQEEFQEFCLRYHEPLIRHVERRGVPVISFVRSGGRYFDSISSMRPLALNLEECVSLPATRQLTALPLQGNLDPDLLFAPLPVIKRKVTELLHAMQGDPAFIVNLGHGIRPQTPWQAAQYLVHLVQEA